jgi:hypothetical protein
VQGFMPTLSRPEVEVLDGLTTFRAPAGNPVRINQLR